MHQHSEPTIRDSESATTAQQFFGPVASEEIIRVVDHDEPRSTIALKHPEPASCYHFIVALIDADCPEKEAESIAHRVWGANETEGINLSVLREQRDYHARERNKHTRALAAIQQIEAKFRA